MVKSTTEKPKEGPKRQVRVPAQRTAVWSGPAFRIKPGKVQSLGRYHYADVPVFSPHAMRIHPLYRDVAEIEDLSVEAERSYDRVLQRINILEERLLAATKVEGLTTRAELHETQVEIRGIKDTLSSRSELTIIDAFKENPNKNIEIMCVFLIAVAVFSLTVSGLFGLHIIHPLFALLSAIGWVGFWTMAKIGR